MIARLALLSPRARLALIVTIILLAPVAGYIGYRFGLFLGRH